MRCPQSCREQKQVLRLDLSCCGSRRFTEFHCHMWGRYGCWLAKAENVSDWDSIWYTLREGKIFRASSTSQNSQLVLRQAEKSLLFYTKHLGKVVHELKPAKILLHNRLWVGHSPCFIFIFLLKIVWPQFSNLLIGKNELTNHPTFMFCNWNYLCWRVLISIIKAF